MPNEVINRIVHINYVQWLMLFYLLPKSCVFNPFFCSVFVNNFVFVHIRMGGFQCDSIAKIKDEHWTYSTVELILDMLNVCKAAIYKSIIICFVATTLSDCKSSIFVYAPPPVSYLCIFESSIFRWNTIMYFIREKNFRH